MVRMLMIKYGLIVPLATGTKELSFLAPALLPEHTLITPEVLSITTPASVIDGMTYSWACRPSSLSSQPQRI